MFKFYESFPVLLYTVFSHLDCGFCFINYAIECRKDTNVIGCQSLVGCQFKSFGFRKSAELSQVRSGYAKESMKDVRSIRDFFCGMDICYFFDAPWSIIYLIVIYMLHPLLGVLVTASFVLLLVVSLFNEIFTREHVKKSSEDGMEAQSLIQSAYANSESIEAMGMFPNIIRRFNQNQKVLLSQKASDNSSFFVSFAQF